MRPTNLPSARSPVVWTRGMPLWTMTVNAGACAAARGTVTAPSRARNARPGLTSEAVVESQRESQGLPGGHRLRHVRSEEHTSELQSRLHLVCRLLLEKKKNKKGGLAVRTEHTP